MANVEEFPEERDSITTGDLDGQGDNGNCWCAVELPRSALSMVGILDYFWERDGIITENLLVR